MSRRNRSGNSTWVIITIIAIIAIGYWYINYGSNQSEDANTNTGTVPAITTPITTVSESTPLFTPNIGLGAYTQTRGIDKRYCYSSDNEGYFVYCPSINGAENLTAQDNKAVVCPPWGKAFRLVPDYSTLTCTLVDG